MANTDFEIHQNDIGTVYRVRVRDQDGPFDPTPATTKQLIFDMPQGRIEKDATIESTGGEFYLTYEVLPGDGIGSPGEFHDQVGRFAVQAYLAFANGTEFHSSIQTLDSSGKILKVHRNLPAS